MFHHTSLAHWVPTHAQTAALSLPHRCRSQCSSVPFGDTCDGRTGELMVLGQLQAPSLATEAASAMGQAPRPQLFCRAHLPHPPYFSETPRLDTCQPSGRPHPCSGRSSPPWTTPSQRDTKQWINMSSGLRSQKSPGWALPAHNCARATCPCSDLPFCSQPHSVLHPGSWGPLPLTHTIRWH